MSIFAGLEPASNLGSYIEQVDGILPLTLEDELQQLKCLEDERRSSAINILVLHHLRFVVNIARDYLCYEQSFADLIQQGNIGLIKAVIQFKPVSGKRLLSSAVSLINSEISSFVLDNWRIVNIGLTKEQRKLFERLRKFRRGRETLTLIEMRAAASQLRIRPTDIARLEKRLCGNDIPLHHVQEEIAFLSVPGHADFADTRDVVEHQHANSGGHWEQGLQRGLIALDDRAQDIVRRRWLNSGKRAKFKDLAFEYQVSGERIRQIQSQAFETIKQFVS